MQRKIHTAEKHENDRDGLDGGAVEIADTRIMGREPTDCDSRKTVTYGIEQIPLPEGANIGAIVRGEKVMMAHHDTLIETDDHLILFMQDRRTTPEVEKLFQVSFTFV